MAMANYSHVSIRKIGKLYETTVNNQFFYHIFANKTRFLLQKQEEIVVFFSKQKRKDI